MAVNDRTLTALQAVLDYDQISDAVMLPEEQLARFAAAYLAYAAANRHRWSALFQHRLPLGHTVMPEYEARQSAVFARVGALIGVIRPDLTVDQRTLWSRTLFSAVHGVVLLGLEEKLDVVSRSTLEGQLRDLVSVLAAGLNQGRP